MIKHTGDAKLISVVAPVYNEEDVIHEFHHRLMAVLSNLQHEVEVIYVNDGSKDSSLALLSSLAADDDRIGVVDLSRNFGKEIAMTAGLDHCRGDAVVVIDTDLQDPPELIVDFIREWEDGFDVVYGRRRSRQGETWLKKKTAQWFYSLIKSVSDVEIPENVGDFRLLSRRALDSLLQLREKHRFMKGLFSWVGYSQKAIDYDRCPRYAGDTKWNYWRLWNFALEGITSFTVSPLIISTYVGFVTSLVAFFYGGFVIVKTLLFGNSVPGYPSLLVVILFLGGIQLMALGVIGEYVGRMFNETKNRPLYLVNKYYRSSNEKMDVIDGEAKLATSSLPLYQVAPSI